MAKWCARNVADPPIKAPSMWKRREREWFEQWKKRSGEHKHLATQMPGKQECVEEAKGAPAHYAAPSPNRKE